ncbi:xyloside xylosyltransferase 1-like [Sitophilus oryzae]|uniref:Xyloside xylosyltransferase 1-like n=1 Tax=Sitophilus oryzae TaxID=7048 RepID=A0A6J2YER0_SITOR|nr:xyloside xylosyltransferase 1-like [Sitophilus oryzae]
MRASSRFYLLNSFVFVIVCFLLYFVVITRRLETEQLKISDVLFEPSKEHSNVDYNVWLIFTKVTNKSTLTFKFQNLISNLLNVSTVPLKFHIIVDEKSKTIAKYKLSEVVYSLNKSLVYTFYNVQDCSTKLSDIVNVMTPFFSSRPGTYFSDALFYISLGLYRIAPSSQKRGILLDCDLYFKKDIALLFDEFDRFKPTALYGLAPELTPVYRHILHMYKLKHNTTFGDYYCDNSITEGIHPHGFQGYNSGVVLIDFEKQRESKQYLQMISRESIKNMTEKYRFRGHLGDQDFYTLLGYEHPDLIQTLNCGFNRQLCTWWKDHGYSDIFKHYFQCNHSIVVLHGNCNTRIPKN